MDIAKTKHFVEYKLAPELQNVYESGRTLRYHANPYMSIFAQTDADHQWGCAALLLKLHPNPSLELIKAAIFHDSGERWAGDIPYPAKIAAPEVAEAHSKVEHQMAAAAGVPTYRITKEDQYWLKFVDRLESHFFALVYRPDVLETVGFAAQKELIKEMSELLGVWHLVEPCFAELDPEIKSKNLLKWLKDAIVSNFETLFGSSQSTRKQRAGRTE